MNDLRKFFKQSLHFIPAVIILVFGMAALQATVSMKRQNDVLHAQNSLFLMQNSPDQVTRSVELRAKTAKLEVRLYWSVLAIGFSGFLLFVLNADKIRRLQYADEDKLVAAEEQKKTQDQLYQAQKMEAVGRLAGGIAHDFNNILAAMNGYAEFLEEDLEKESKLHGYAVNILQAGNQARSLVDQMMAFSRTDSNKTTTMDLSIPLNETLSMLKASLPKSLDVKTDIALSDAIIEGNATQVAQVLMNLCVNAGDAMEGESGVLKISMHPFDVQEDAPLSLLVKELPDPKDTPPITTEEIAPGHIALHLGTLAQDAEYVCLSVADTGTGISEQIMKKMFEPFFTTKSVEKGTGLGLSTVHGVVTAHRAAMKIDSIIGEGTCFEIYFPLSQAGEESESETSSATASDCKAHVLLVEDQSDVREMTAIALGRLGHDVTAVENGLFALDALRENPERFDVVLTDHNMPKMTGLELVYQAHMDFPELPFILLSGYSEEKLVTLMNEHEAIKAIIHKPVKKEELGQTIASVVKNAQHARAA